MAVPPRLSPYSSDNRRLTALQVEEIDWGLGRGIKGLATDGQARCAPDS